MGNLLTTRAGQVKKEVKDVALLMKLNGENIFKVRAFEKAVDILDTVSVDEIADRVSAGTLTEIKGIGSGIAGVITEFVGEGTNSVKEEIESQLPDGLTDLVVIPGLGPKKARSVIDELNVRSISELEYACQENHLVGLKGFGQRAQDKIYQGIQFLNANAGKMRLVDALDAADTVLQALQKANDGRVVSSGELARHSEVLTRLDFLAELPEEPKGPKGKEQSKKNALVEKKLKSVLEKNLKELELAIPAEVKFAYPKHFGYHQVKGTASKAHWQALGEPKEFSAPTENAFYQKQKIPVILPVMRETGEEVALAKKGKLQDIVQEKDLQGVFHNHTLRSDGSATLEQMVLAAKKLGYQYLGISDHSQTSAIAGGLKLKDINEQEKEVRSLQDKYPDFKIFWGIESDILKDGRLDYPDKVLKRFDFVIVSVHQRFSLNKKDATARVVRALEHPATRMIGHLTGRLLLGRPPYEMDIEKVIDVATKNQVAIEINAHPSRLDIDWRWGKELRKNKTWVSINPDAHSTKGLKDTRFGVTVAQKALLPKKQVLNTMSIADVDRWLKRN